MTRSITGSLPLTCLAVALALVAPPGLAADPEARAEADPPAEDHGAMAMPAADAAQDSSDPTPPLMAMQMGSMQGGQAPPDARDPDAWADGYEYAGMPGFEQTDQLVFGTVLVDELELASGDEGEGLGWSWQAAYGGDQSKLWLRSQGLKVEGQPVDPASAARSDHPVSLAVARAAVNDGLTPRDVADFAALPGRGVRGDINGQIYHLGNHRLVEELGMCSPDLESRVSALEAEGKTVVMLIGQDGVRALFAVADTVKDSSRQAIAELHRLGVKAIMLTGDNPHTATAIASQVGIDRSRGNLLPEDKLHEVEQLSADGKTGMVGDGINDAPALARADIGFAMGAAGTDTAIETADVALMDDDLRKLPTFVRLSRATASVLKQNIALALGIKAVFLILTFTGQATMWMAVFADMGASLLVVGNGLRLLRR